MVQRFSGLLGWPAFLWAAFNCVYVYGVLGGARVHRVETAVFVLLAVMAPRAIAASRSDAAGEPLPPRWIVAGAALAAGLWLIIYLPLLTFPFLSDDYVFLALYEGLDDFASQSLFFRPMFALVFWGVRSLFGDTPAPFHVVSLLLHGGSAWIVHRLARRLFGASGPAALAGALFLLNPLQLEAVLWISGLQELLWSFFVLAALDIHVGSRQLTWPRIAAAAGLIACGLLSKETAVCYVLLVPAADAMLFRMQRGRRLIAAYGLFAVELVAYLLVRARFKTFDDTMLAVPSRYFIKQFVATPYRFFVHPWNADAVDVPALVLCAVGTVVLVLLFLTLRRRGFSRPLVAGAFAILATTLPLSGYFFVGADLIASRYIYCAAAGWALIMGEFVAGTARRRGGFMAVAAALMVGSALSLALNLRPWLVARDVVHALAAGAKRGDAPAAVLARFEQERGVEVPMKDGAPYIYQGVGIFINGYPEFLEIAGRRDRVP